MNNYYLIWISVLYLVLVRSGLAETEDDNEVEGHQDDEAVNSNAKKILILGGNGFMGAGTVNKLLKRGYDITIVNRGNWYWDSEKTVKPHVRHFTCDRKGTLDKHCPEFTEYLKNIDRFEAVIDFSAYAGHEVKQSTKLLDGIADLYILISSDAIYDVSGLDPSEGHVHEHEAGRPQEEDDIKILKHYYARGHDKREAEEALEEANVPYIILRLPDVIGPRDTTNRFWLYQLWLKVSNEMEEHKVTVPEFLHDYPMSFVYSEDVSNMIVWLATTENPEFRDTAYNLGWPQTFTLHNFMESIQDALGLPQDGFDTHEGDGAFYLYPTIRRGPLNVTKAQEKLNWEPTRWEEAIRNTVHFYENAFSDEEHADSRNEIIQVVENMLFSTQSREERIPFYEALEKLYNIELHHFKRAPDEL